MKFRNTKRRSVKDNSGRKIPFNLKRYHCAVCNKLHTEIPDIIFPYRQYEKSVIEEVCKGNISTFSGDDSTIRYWKKNR